MKKLASVVCMMALAWHIGVRPSVAAGTQPPGQVSERPLAAAIAAAGHNFGHLLSQSGTNLMSADRVVPVSGARMGNESQTGSNRMSAGRETKILLAAAIGFVAGFGFVYFVNDGPFDRWDHEQAAMLGTALAAIAGSITYVLTRP